DLISVFPDDLAVIAVSSSVLAESCALGVRNIRALAGFPWVVAGFEALSAPWAVQTGMPPFTAVDGRLLSDRCWERALGRTEVHLPNGYRSTDGILRRAWGENWGLNAQAK